MTSAVDKSDRNTGTKDKHYDLVSVLYHALGNVVTYEQYIQDARAVDDSELIRFFQELRESNCHAASKAKRLLKERII